MGDQQSSIRESNRWGVLLLAHGAPERLEDVPEFLLQVRGGRKLPEAAVQEIVQRYARVGGGSPLLRLTNRQAEALAKLINYPVYVGMRNWKPFIHEAVRRLSDDGIERVVAPCLAPQNSTTSIGLYRKHLFDAIGASVRPIEVEFIESWHDHPLLVGAFAEKVVQTLARAESEAGKPVAVIFTAHSVPEKTIVNGDPYERQVQQTAALVVAAVGSSKIAGWAVAFQSQGMTSEPWIGPTVESQIDALAAAGHRHVVIAPIGFVSDHVEILYDIDIVFQEYGQARGVKLWRAESLNDSPLFIRALAEIVSARIEQTAERARR